MVGIFEMMTPAYMIKEPELIKQIMIKDFDCFVNRRILIATDSDPILPKTLFGAQDKIWRELRLLLTPAFTGSKMRFLFDLIRDCADEIVQHIERKVVNGEYRFEARELFSRCADDVIATSAFGIKINSFEAENNIIFSNGSKLTDFSAKDLIIFFLYVLMPKVMNALKIPVFNQITTNNLLEVLRDVIKQREQTGGHRPDMIQLLLQAKHKGHIDGDQPNDTNQSATSTSAREIILNDEYLQAQCIGFFLAGFETVSSFLSLMAYELAINPEVQRTLQAEIDALDAELQGKLPTYDQLQKMSYLDMTVQGEQVVGENELFF